MSFKIEQGVEKSYFQYSPGQIATIGARYEAAKKFALDILGVRNINRWLDIGPNKSSGPKILSKLSTQLTFIDIKSDFLKNGLGENSNVTGLLMDGCSLGFPDKTFDVVTALEVVEHIEPEKQSQMFKEAARVLKKNGLFIVSTPNKIASGKRAMSPDHKREFLPQELREALNESGFVINVELGQWFFNESLLHQLFRQSRQNPLAVFIYYHLLPWQIRRRVRDITLTSQEDVEIRPAKEKETPRITFMVCQKKCSNL